MKRSVALLLCICCFSALLLTSCNSTISNEKELDFVNCYNTYVKGTYVKSDTAVIKRVDETVDANGGALVHFTYEYTTSGGYKASRSFYMVTSKITIDSSLITLDEDEEILYKDEIFRLNGKSVDTGFVAKDIPHNSKDEDIQIIRLWQRVQSGDLYTDAYDVDIINNLISK